MLTAQGIVRDYDPSTDTATVELTAIGAIDTWIAGLQIEWPINRANVVNGASVTLSLPDTHRLCEARIISVQGSVNNVVSSAGTAGQRTEQGRAYAFLDGAGNGSVTVTFPIAFSAPPTVYAQGDFIKQWNLSAISATGFTATLAVAGTPSSYLYLTWLATGPA